MTILSEEKNQTTRRDYFRKAGKSKFSEQLAKPIASTDSSMSWSPLLKDTVSDIMEIDFMSLLSNETGKKLDDSTSSSLLSEEYMEEEMLANIARLKREIFEAAQKSILTPIQDKNYHNYVREHGVLTDKLAMIEKSYRAIVGESANTKRAASSKLASVHLPHKVQWKGNAVDEPVGMSGSTTHNMLMDSSAERQYERQLAHAPSRSMNYVERGIRSPSKNSNNRCCSKNNIKHAGGNSPDCRYHPNSKSPHTTRNWRNFRYPLSNNMCMKCREPGWTPKHKCSKASDKKNWKTNNTFKNDHVHDDKDTPVFPACKTERPVFSTVIKHEECNDAKKNVLLLYLPKRTIN